MALPAFAIRVQGRRWLRLTPPHKGPTNAKGWREFTWTNRLDEAEKFGNRERAEIMARHLACPAAVVDLSARAA